MKRYLLLLGLNLMMMACADIQSPEQLRQREKDSAGAKTDSQECKGYFRQNCPYGNSNIKD